MTVDDLIADRQTDAAAPGLGRPLVEFLLYIGQLRLRNARAEVPDGDLVAAVRLPQVDGDAFARSAVLGGVVQQVAEHLLQPIRVAGDGLFVDGLIAGVLQGDAVLLEQLPVGVYRVLQFRLQIHILHLEGKAPILHAGELQQLLHHVRQATGLLDDDAQSAAQLLHVAALVCQQRLAPAVDGRQGRAQLVGHRGDELGLHFLTLADLAGHIVDIAHQLAHLVGIPVGYLLAVAAAGDTLGGLRHGGNRRHHIVDEDHAGQDDQAHHRQHDTADHQHRQQHLTVDVPDGGDVTHDAHHLTVELQQAGHGKDTLPRLAVTAYEILHLTGLHGPENLRRVGICGRRQAAGGDLHPAGAVEKLQLNAVTILKGRRVQRGAAVVLPIAGHDVGVEIVRAGGRLGPEGRLGAVIVVAGKAHGDQHAHQQQNDHHRADAAGDPATAQTLDYFPFGCHGWSSPFRRVNGSLYTREAFVCCNAQILCQDETQDRRHTLCMARHCNAVSAQKMRITVPTCSRSPRSW